MKKEIGKWLMDVAKYMVTAILLSSIFSDLQNTWMYVGIILSIIGIFALGLWFIKDKRKEE